MKLEACMLATLLALAPQVRRRKMPQLQMATTRPHP